MFVTQTNPSETSLLCKLQGIYFREMLEVGYFCMRGQLIYTVIVCGQAILLPSKPHPLLPSRGLDLISLEKEACVHIPHPPVLPQYSIVCLLPSPPSPEFVLIEWHEGEKKKKKSTSY